MGPVLLRGGARAPHALPRGDALARLLLPRRLSHARRGELEVLHHVALRRREGRVDALQEAVHRADPVVSHQVSAASGAGAAGTPEVHRSILVVGGGIAGVTAAFEAADAGYDVVIVEKNPYLGGRAAQLYRYFPKLCPPYCGMEINLRRIKNNPQVRFHTLAQVESIAGRPGNFDVTVRLHPRYVNDRCTACNACVEVCPEDRPNAFNFGMGTTKAIYLPHEMAFP